MGLVTLIFNELVSILNLRKTGLMFLVFCLLLLFCLQCFFLGVARPFGPFFNRFCQRVTQVINSRRRQRLLFRRSPFFNLLYLLITFFVLHKSRFSRLTSDLLHSLFQLKFLHAFN